MRAPLLLPLVLVLGAPSCSSSTPSAPPVSPAFDLHADLAAPSAFFQLPYPSDLRLTAAGAPDLRAFPNLLPSAAVTSLKALASLRKGFPLMPVGYFQMSGPVAPRHFTSTVAADASQPLLLIDVDPSSPERGKLFPLVAETPPSDDYVPDNLLALAAHPGILLNPRRTYAFVLMKALGDAAGKPLGPVPAFSALLSAAPPASEPELAAWKLYQPLWQTLRTRGIDPSSVVAATVFTTGDVVADAAARSDALRAKYKVLIRGLSVRKDGNQPRTCELTGSLTYPIFQKGTPPYDTDGGFELDADGLPAKQRDEVAPIAISLPQTAMPAAGYPLVVYVHGSGGLSTQLFDRGKITSAQPNGTPHEGPAFVVAAHGLAMAGSAMPLNPERLPGAQDLAYLNFNNLGAFPFVFQQGLVEQRLFADALARLVIDPSVVKGCSGISIPAGTAAITFDVTRLALQGQSMGGMYASMVGAVEPRFGAVAPSGAGGFWSYMVLTTRIVDASAGKVGLLLATREPLTFLHPGMSLLETAWEPAEPLVYMQRIAKSPLPGHPQRAAYEPVGKDDEYFSTEIYDAAALAFGNAQAGEVVWNSMQDTLSLDGRGGVLPYPAANDVSTPGGKSTGVVVQFAGDGVADPHYVFQQLDAVKYQYGCFFASFAKTGIATVPAPAPLDAPCPGM